MNISSLLIFKLILVFIISIERVHSKPQYGSYSGEYYPRYSRHHRLRPRYRYNDYDNYYYRPRYGRYYAAEVDNDANPLVVVEGDTTSEPEEPPPPVEEGPEPGRGHRGGHPGGSSGGVYIVSDEKYRNSEDRASKKYIKAHYQGSGGPGGRGGYGGGFDRGMGGGGCGHGRCGRPHKHRRGIRNYRSIPGRPRRPPPYV